MTMLNSLTLIQKGNAYFIDSREVAVLIGKRHDHLLRDIRGYAEIIRKTSLPNFGERDFFVASSYKNSRNQDMPCYLITKSGAEVIANKLTGEKGVLFTAAYVTRFNMMESHLRAEWEKSQKLLPTLSDCNDTAKIVVRQLKRTGATTYRILDFLDELYQPLGIELLKSGEFSDIPQTYSAIQIARICGVYSLYGNPHAQAVSCILNEHLCVGEEHKLAVSDDWTGGIMSRFRYDQYALERVQEWLNILNYPRNIYSDYRVYHVVYRAAA